MSTVSQDSWRTLVAGLSLSQSIVAAEILGMIELKENNTGVLLGHISMPGSLRYLFILAVVDTSTYSIDLWVTSEASEGPPFLCAQKGSKRYNFGANEIYADQNQFLKHAIPRVSFLS